jgi:hypothetical protein
VVIPDQVRKCVAFVAIRMADGSFRFVGSGFFYGRDLENDSTRATSVHFVTARHVIDKARTRGLTTIFIRVNQKQGEAVWSVTQLADWIFHPTDKSIDVAMLPCRVSATLDHLVLPASIGGTEEKLKCNEVGLGDEVFITGLFSHHHGNRRNIPIVRIGNISCLVEEKVVTKDYGEIDAYLIEARSIGGLSGSPVFVNLGSLRPIGGTVTFGRRGPSVLLLGLIHGHFDSQISSSDKTDVLTKDEGFTSEAVNTGIAVVVPFQRIDEVFLIAEKRALTQKDAESAIG